MSLGWYAIQTYSGSEQSVKKAIENLVQELGLQDRVKEVVVPTEDIYEMKDGAKKISARSIYPGYVFIHVDLDTSLWHTIQSLPRVSGFIGESKKPTPLSEADITHILEKNTNRAAPKPKVSFDPGEVVRINEGPFANFTATVEGYDIEHKKLKLNVSIFGRNTPIEILYSQVEKIV
ncbi:MULTISPECIES: transcription termination/antitermination protein NusG [Helicobacter]|uniref:Transcription termination/antitermination protein NusG n=2 Tax=Helicobacter TaxID=209 RepID=A0A377J6C7_9HELI|nr:MULTISPECIES: transcription termination/antitermination protein NusG [Helicobacter]MDL0080939.1 transcription termination/antitermination protein NusG [Helicobacter sp. CPD2-1]MDL0081960.1 transcription termination/antitermination protein NusG [Helicobacter sp. XJK30-2]STO98052.1 transcription termination/antitermination factor NusG [Helicobacter canis]